MGYEAGTANASVHDPPRGCAGGEDVTSDDS